MLCGERQGVGGEASLRDAPGTRLEAGSSRQELVQFTVADSLLPPLDLDRPAFAVSAGDATASATASISV